MTMFLTHDELVELTERKTKGAQIAWLKANRFQFVAGANGHPKVLRAHVQAKLCGGTVAASAQSSAEPNWGAL
jgi:hypothetical protein